MIEVKQAIKLAHETFHDWLQRRDDAVVTLEEVELTDDERFWNITLGYNEPIEVLDQVDAFPFAPPSPPTRGDRKYKVFKIDAETGRVYSMKIRQSA